MPIYEYSCKSCGHEWEEMQKITDAILAAFEPKQSKVIPLRTAENG